MAIRIIEDEDIYLTPEEQRRFQQEYEDFCQGAYRPPSFEEFVKQKKKFKEENKKFPLEFLG